MVYEVQDLLEMVDMVNSVEVETVDIKCVMMDAQRGISCSKIVEQQGDLIAGEVVVPSHLVESIEVHYWTGKHQQALDRFTVRFKTVSLASLLNEESKRAVLKLLDSLAKRK